VNRSRAWRLHVGKRTGLTYQASVYFNGGIHFRVSSGRPAIQAWNGHRIVRVISFKNTILLKRGVWLTAAALIAFAVTPSVLDGSLQQNPVSSLFAVGILCAFLVYFLWKTQIHRLADEVMDCDDHLKVRRGRSEETIRFSNIATADVSTSSGIHRITVRLHQPTKLGAQIEFLPQASLWSNLSGVKRVAAGLTDRANQAKGGREMIDS
jgi:hypothetical protein